MMFIYFAPCPKTFFPIHLKRPLQPAHQFEGICRGSLEGWLSGPLSTESSWGGLAYSCITIVWGNTGVKLVLLCFILQTASLVCLIVQIKRDIKNIKRHDVAEGRKVKGADLVELWVETGWCYGLWSWVHPSLQQDVSQSPGSERKREMGW